VPASPASVPRTASRRTAPERATQSSRGATTSAAPGTCSATPASGRIRTCSRSGIHFGPGRKPRPSQTGPSILKYLRETAREFGIDRHIRFRHRVLSASWSSDEARWTVECVVGGKEPLDAPSAAAAGPGRRSATRATSCTCAAATTTTKAATHRPSPARTITRDNSFTHNTGPETSTTAASASW